MKKFLLIILILLILITPIFSSDCFSFMENSKKYVKFYESIKNDDPVAEDLYSELNFSSFTEEQQYALEISCKIEYARYLVSHDDKKTAKDCLKSANKLLSNIKDNDLYYNILLAQLNSYWYLIDHFKYLFKAINSTKLTKDNYNKWPDEKFIILQYANQILYTPGKSPKVALEIFNKLNDVTLAPWYQFSYYSGLGICNYKLNNFEEAKKYLEIATNIYTGDNTLKDALADINKED